MAEMSLRRWALAFAERNFSRCGCAFLLLSKVK
jgi:hypothetical protein